MQEDLLWALDTDQLSQAVLDVTDPEPLPEHHAFWSHPSIFLTPHVASSSRVKSGGKMILKNILRYEEGIKMIREINVISGY